VPSPSPSPDKPPRITEGERDAAVERLKEAIAEGHLSTNQNYKLIVFG
jgi:hypothetical protein